MFRGMRRFKQGLSTEECAEILRKNTSGVLAVSGDDGYPYAVPLSYAYADSRLYFHCAPVGHKIDAIARNAKVSFCVVDKDQVVPEKYTTFFRSVILFGKARVVTDEAEKRRALGMLAAKYSPDDEEGREQEIDRQFSQVCLVEIAVDHITGKEAIELAKMKHPQ